MDLVGQEVGYAFGEGIHCNSGRPENEVRRDRMLLNFAVCVLLGVNDMV
jgi:hypothetical protein